MTLSKPLLISLLGLWLVVPFLGGGRDTLAGILIFFAVSAALFLIFRSQQQVRLAGWGPILLLMMLGWGALSLTWTPNRFETITWVIGWYTLLGAFVVGQWLRQTGRWQGWLRGYVWIVSAAAVYGIYLFIVADYNRLTSTFYWANPMAGYLLPAVFLSAYWWSQKGRWYDGVTTVITVCSLLLTYSRGGIGAAVLITAMAAVLVLLKRILIVGGRQVWIRFVVMVIVAFALSTIIPQLRDSDGPTTSPAVSQESRFADAVSGESVSISDRLNYLDSSLAIWIAHPITGSGAGSWSTVYPKYQKQVISATSSAHNWYAQTIAELGVVGGVLLAAFILALAWSARQLLKDHNLLPVVLGLAALILHMAVDIDYSYPAILLLFGVLSGVVYQTRQRAGNYSKPILAIAVVLTLPAILIYQSQTAAEHGSIWQDNREYLKAAESFQQSAGGVVYDPDSLTAAGINLFTLAGAGVDIESNANKARELAEHAIQLDRLDSQHYFLLARSHLLLRQYEEAERRYRQAIEKDNLNHPEYYVDLVRLLMFQQRWQEALAEAGRVIALYPADVVTNRHIDESIAPTIDTAQALRAELLRHLPAPI